MRRRDHGRWRWRATTPVPTIRGRSAFTFARSSPTWWRAASAPGRRARGNSAADVNKAKTRGPRFAGAVADHGRLAFSSPPPHEAPPFPPLLLDAAHGFQMRHRRLAERRQVDPVQRADADLRRV